MVNVAENQISSEQNLIGDTKITPESIATRGRAKRGKIATKRGTRLSTTSPAAVVGFDEAENERVVGATQREINEQNHLEYDATTVEIGEDVESGNQTSAVGSDTAREMDKDGTSPYNHIASTPPVAVVRGISSEASIRQQEEIQRARMIVRKEPAPSSSSFSLEAHSAEWPNQPALIWYPVPSDGSCLLHALRACVARKYRYRDKAYMVQWAARARDELAALLPQYYNDLPCADFADIQVRIDGHNLRFDLEGMQERLRSTRFLGEEMLIFFSRIFNVNIILLDKRQKRVYRVAVAEQLYDDTRPGAVMIFYDTYREHFEPAALLYDGENISYFENNHVALCEFRAELGW